MALRERLPTWLGGTSGRATNLDVINAGLPAASRRVDPGRPPVGQDEYGVSGTENFGGVIRREDFNPELDDFQKAVVIYDKMRRTDGQIRAMLEVIKLPLRSATWMAQPPDGGDGVDQQIADFVNQSLFDDDAMDESWDFTLRHILMQLDFGFAVLEKVWRVDNEGHFKFKRLAPRLPKTIREWHVHRNGQLRAVVQYAPVPHGSERLPIGLARTSTYTTTVTYQYLTIPAEYLGVFVLGREGDNYEGWSVLRTVYRNWWFKDQAYRIYGVGLDRWGVGIPVAELDEDHQLGTIELDKLTDVLKAMRSNEKAFLIAPPHVRYRILPDTNVSAGPNVIGWIDHHDAQIARNVLAGFLTLAREGGSGLGSGLGSRLTDMFVSSLNGVAKGIAGDLKRQVVKPLCEYNFDMTGRQLPSIICRDLEQVDMQNLVEVLAKLMNVVITPDDDVEAMMRKMLKLPPLAEELTRREIARDAAQKEAIAPAGTPVAPKTDPRAAPAEAQVQPAVAPAVTPASPPPARAVQPDMEGPSV